MNGSILLLEDSELDVMLARRALAVVVPGASIVHAMDGEQAWEHLDGKGLRPLFALVDIRVPKISGLELLQKIRQHEELKELPVIVMSSSDDERDLAEARRFKADAYVCKVMDSAIFVDNLQDAVKPLLARKRGPNECVGPRQVLRPCLT